MMTGSLTDELDATFQEMDQLAEQRKQAEVYERAVVRLRFLSSHLEALVEDMRRVRFSSSVHTWSCICQALRCEQPSELATVGRALMDHDASFLRVVIYLGFARGVLTARDEAPTNKPLPTED